MYRFCYICPSCAVAHMLQDVLTLKSPNVTIVFLKLDDLFVKNNNVVINKRFQSLYYCVHISADVLYQRAYYDRNSHIAFSEKICSYPIIVVPDSVSCIKLKPYLDQP